MIGIAAYLTALFAMLFAAGSALTLIHFVSHLDSPTTTVPEESRPVEPIAA